MNLNVGQVGLKAAPFDRSLRTTSTEWAMTTITDAMKKTLALIEQGFFRRQRK
jgi:hypothetical protein